MQFLGENGSGLLQKCRALPSLQGRTGGHDVRPTCVQPARRLHVGRPHMNALPWAKHHPSRINSFVSRNKAHNAHQGCWIRSDQQRSPAEVFIPASRLQVPLLGSSPSVGHLGLGETTLRFWENILLLCETPTERGDYSSLCSSPWYIVIADNLIFLIFQAVLHSNEGKMLNHFRTWKWRQIRCYGCC